MFHRSAAIVYFQHADLARVNMQSSVDVQPVTTILPMLRSSGWVLVRHGLLCATESA
jgi:hypothetical protein